MVVHWETSLKPLFVRTVWLRGHRHAILSDDDPAVTAMASHTGSSTNRSSRNSRGHSPSSNSDPSADLMLNATAHPLYSIVSNKHQVRSYRNNVEISRLQLPIHRTDDYKEDHNPLSERVLQWLDLAGKESIKFEIDNTESGNNESEITIPENKQVPDSARHKKDDKIFKKQTNKKKQVYTEKVYNNISDNEEDKYTQEQILTTTLVSDSIQNYAKLAMNHNEKDFETSFPSIKSVSPNNIVFEEENITKNASYKLQNKKKNKGKKNNLSSSLSLSSGDDINGNSINEELKQPVRRASIQMGSFQQECRDLITKKIKENNYKSKSVKRQLHIFMPTLPKKNSSCENSIIGGDCV